MSIANLKGQEQLVLVEKQTNKQIHFHCVVPRIACGRQVLRGPAKFPGRLEESTEMGDEFCLTFLVDTCVRGNSLRLKQKASTRSGVGKKVRGGKRK